MEQVFGPRICDFDGCTTFIVRKKYTTLRKMYCDKHKSVVRAKAQFRRRHGTTVDRTCRAPGCTNERPKGRQWYCPSCRQNYVAPGSARYTLYRRRFEMMAEVEPPDRDEHSVSYKQLIDSYDAKFIKLVDRIATGELIYSGVRVRQTVT